jgi:hypothetical protein
VLKLKGGLQVLLTLREGPQIVLTLKEGLQVTEAGIHIEQYRNSEHKLVTTPHNTLSVRRPPYHVRQLSDVAQVCMVLRFVAEEVMVFADDMRQDSKRALLAGLIASLPAVLPDLTSQLERHFGGAISASRAGQKDLAEAHVAAVAAGLGALSIPRQSGVPHSLVSRAVYSQTVRLFPLFSSLCSFPCPHIMLSSILQ